MGIKHFFYWFYKQFSHHIHKLRKHENVGSKNIKIDTLMLDMNGIIHRAAQKNFKYGDFKPKHRRLLKKVKTSTKQSDIQRNLFKDVCSAVSDIINVTNPSKRVVLCIDGPAPISKQNQQRQRRFRSSMETTDTDISFDSNCITPGTQFMDNLSKYIDWYIRKKINSDPYWRRLEIIFSNEKVPGEGEHKILNFIREYGTDKESYCIHGLDADLIMLALGTHLPNMYILREDLYDASNEYFCINVGKIHGELSDNIRWDSIDYYFVENNAINDFIFLCFTVGNDFLPHVPSIEIIEDGIELILEIYTDIGASCGHITRINNAGHVEFIPSLLEFFFETIGQYEKKNFETKLRRKRSYFPDPTINECSTKHKDTWVVDIEKYKKKYMLDFFPDTLSEETICHEYLKGMQWVISYYTKGVPDWDWYYTHHYAPPASILSKHMKTFVIPLFGGGTIPSKPFKQLLSVLPPSSATLIPKPLCNMLSSPYSPLKKYCPDEIKIDLAGKRKEWEGVVLLPMVNFTKQIEEYYLEMVKKVDSRDLKRNIFGKSFIYVFRRHPYTFKSCYGVIKNCYAGINFINI